MKNCCALAEWNTSKTDDNSMSRSILVLGLGNPILGDDGLGWRVAEQVAQHFHTWPAIETGSVQPANTPSGIAIEVDCLAVGGLALMERLIGYSEAIIIDSLSTGDHSIGDVNRFDLTEMPERALGHLCSAHDTSLQNALRVGKSMGARLPEKILVIGIEAKPIFEFSETLSPAILASIPKAVALIMEELK